MSSDSHLQADHLHPIKGVSVKVDTGAPEGNQQPVRTKADVGTHEVCVHAHQRDAEGLAAELDLEVNGLPDNL